MFSNRGLEGIALSTGSTSERTNKVGEHLLNTYCVPGTVYHFTYIISTYSPINLKKKVVVFDLRELIGVVTGQRTIHSGRSTAVKEQAQS